MWRYLILPTIIAVAALILEPSASLVQLPSAVDSSTAMATNSHVATPSANAGQRNEIQQGEQQRQQIMQQQQVETFKQLLATATAMGQGNLQAWLDKFWHACQAMGRTECSALQAQLAQYLTPEEQQWLQQAVTNYGEYYRSMTELTLSTEDSLNKRLATLTQLRENYFGEQNAAIFGDEQRYAQYQLDYAELQQHSTQDSVEQRLEKLQALQENLQLSSGKDELLNADTQYQQALDLLQDLPENQQAQWRDKLRKRYFGEQAEEVAAYEQQQAQHKHQQLTYQQALNQLNERWQQRPEGLNSAEYQQALKQLRQQVFGG